eukprot:469252-Hanusia_phi.AAC.2
MHYHVCINWVVRAQKEVEQAQKELELAKLRLERAQQRLKDSRASSERVLNSFREDESPASEAPDPTSPYFEATSFFLPTSKPSSVPRSSQIIADGQFSKPSMTPAML